MKNVVNISVNQPQPQVVVDQPDRLEANCVSMLRS